MSRRRNASKAAAMVASVFGIDKGETPDETPDETPAVTVEKPWWSTMTSKQFKAAIGALTYEECVVLLETIRESIRRVTLRQYVEDMTLDEQKAAGRIAPVYRGCAEALLTKIHAFQRPNDPLPR